MASSGCWVGAAAMGLALASCGDRPPQSGTEPLADPPPQAAAESCADRDPQRTAFFGELHVHTRYSMDAYSWDVRASPDDAYRFARGEAVRLPPLDASGRGTRELRLERPLDFAAVTDHAAYLGPVSICTRQGSPSYDSAGCETYRSAVAGDSPFGELGARMAGFFAIPEGADPTTAMLASQRFSAEICGEQGSLCEAEEASVWAEIQAAAERWNQGAPDCGFTAFKAYEYTWTPEMSKVHRNVIFRNAAVPAEPITWMDEPGAPGLWRELAARCLDAGNGCDVLTIPHNSNLSNGRIFTLGYRGEALEEQLARARLRAALEPLAEISQIKGDSECRNGMYRVVGDVDELCDYEKIRQFQASAPEDCEEGTGAGALAGRGCQSRLDFVRYALVEGLREAERIGVNPLKLGIVAATDAHNANPGDSQERSFDGWSGSQDASVADRLGAEASPIPGQRFGVVSNPGGLAGIWAEENSRDSLFDAMRRRESFGTSGPRIQPRFFGGWAYPADLCDAPEFVARGYAGGVPMGGDLPAPSGAAPVFAVAALRDPGTPEHPGGLLQRIQIVKGWADEQGSFHQAVYDVAGSAQASADVEPATCQPRGVGADSLCGVWRDPDFDASRHAVYYARVVENPSCRWNAWQCLSLPEGERPASCTDPTVPRLIQERAWTSPIWYAPAADS